YDAESVPEPERASAEPADAGVAAPPRGRGRTAIRLLPERAIGLAALGCGALAAAILAFEFLRTVL
ncbi:MAG TPA: hypothetical protein VHB30_10705, partial [Solirubrobacteraceae bacterium]|nr:hypothetical protein [Solirubrobacteraceae bacterium]